MGEIYRSASVTGTRKLETERISKVNLDASGRGSVAEKEQVSKKTKSGKKSRSEISLDDPQVQTSTEVVSTDSENPQMQQDMLVVQQRRIDQLEEVTATLKAEIAAREDELEVARETIERQLAEHKDAGYQAGYDEAAKNAEEQKLKLESQYIEARNLFAEALNSRMDKVNHYAVDVAFAALVRLVGEHYAQSSFGRAVIEEALSAVRGAGRVAVHISQYDFDRIKGIEAELAESSQVTELELNPDPRVSVGGCLIETENGVWDARLETQLQRLKDAIEQSMGPSQ